MTEIEGGVVDSGVSGSEGRALTGRRQALKAGAAIAGVTAAAWAIPTISGVGITPADAAVACSAAGVARTVAADTSWPPPAPPTVMQFQFNVASTGGTCSDETHWNATPGAGAFTVFPGTYYAQSVTIHAVGPSGNVAGPCSQTVAHVTSVTASGATDSASPFQYTITRDHIPVGKNGDSCPLSGPQIQTKTYTLNCQVHMQVNSCPPAAFSNSDACMIPPFNQPTGAGGCSAGLNGDATGTVTVTCTSA